MAFFKSVSRGKTLKMNREVRQAREVFLGFLGALGGLCGSISNFEKTITSQPGYLAQLVRWV
jgi:hypothetical protein